MFLRDEDIKSLVSNGSIINVADMTSNPDGPMSPIQPCSLDLTIGKIFLPRTASGNLGGCDIPKEDHSLKVGETVVVETAEVFHLPRDIGGFGFPPTSVSNVGVLITNLGHIDPGYDGTIRFTLVNMGSHYYSLKKGQVIYTLLLFKLGAAPVQDYRERHPEVDRTIGFIGVKQELLYKLSRDFLDVEHRAQDAAKSSVTSELRTPLFTAMTTGIVAVLTLGGGAGLAYYRVDQVEKNLTELENKLQNEISNLSKKMKTTTDIYELQAEIELIKDQLKNLEKSAEGENK